jgi:predicted DNA-binding transcriptional regulator YafY
VGELGLGTVFAAAQAKLLAALPKDVADRAFLVRQRFHLDAAGWFRSSRVPPQLGPVAAAVWEGRRLEIVYRHVDDGDEAQRVLDPLGLVLKAGVWYLIAARDGETRTYRVSRIQSAKPLAQEATRPNDFDLARHWAASVASFEVSAHRLTVAVRGTARAIGALPQVERDTVSSPPTDSRDIVSATVMFDDLDAAARELMPLGGQVEVIDPPELRDRLRQVAQDIVAVYGGRRARPVSESNIHLTAGEQHELSARRRRHGDRS